MDTRKYIFENGMMKLNPNYRAPGNQSQPSTVAAPDKALAIVSSTQDIMDATNAQLSATGKPMQLSPATTASMEIMQDGRYLEQFHAPQKVDGGQLLDGLSNIFARYEVPIGLINKLLALSEYKLNFIVDDSGSMSMNSDAPLAQASDFMRQKCDPQGKRVNSFNNKMTRWEEAEDRIHVMIDMLAFIPTDNITITFLNRNNRIVLDHKGKSTQQFAQDAHYQVSNAFAKEPSNQTPIYRKLSESFSQATGSTMHYLFTDGVPNDRSVEDVKQLVLTRRNPQLNPLTFMSCTNDDSEAEWMKEIEETAPYTAELDDFESEKKEVLNDQGPGFPFSRGFWLLCQLVAAINPHDLDALDESVPFTKQTMDNLLGRRLTAEEFQYYFRNNPNAQKYSHLYNEFAREDLMAHQILNNIKQGVYSQYQSSQNSYMQSTQTMQTSTQSSAYNPINSGYNSTNSGMSTGNPGNPGNPGASYNNSYQQGNSGFSSTNTIASTGNSGNPPSTGFYSGNSGYNPGLWNSQANSNQQGTYPNPNSTQSQNYTPYRRP